MLTPIQPSVEKDLPTHGEDLMADETNAGATGDIAQPAVATEVPAKGTTATESRCRSIQGGAGET